MVTRSVARNIICARVARVAFSLSAYGVTRRARTLNGDINSSGDLRSGITAARMRSAAHERSAPWRERGNVRWRCVAPRAARLRPLHCHHSSGRQTTVALGAIIYHLSIMASRYGHIGSENKRMAK